MNTNTNETRTRIHRSWRPSRRKRCSRGPSRDSTLALRSPPASGSRTSFVIDIVARSRSVHGSSRSIRTAP